MYFLLFRIFGQLALALETAFALKFFNPGGRPTPAPPPRTPMDLGQVLDWLLRLHASQTTAGRTFALWWQFKGKHISHSIAETAAQERPIPWHTGLAKDHDGHLFNQPW